MSSNTETPQPQPLFVQYMAFKADPAWRRLPLSARVDGRETFALAVEEAAPEVATYAYSMVGLKIGADLLLWRKCSSPLTLQEMTSRILQTGMGAYLEPTHSLFGFTRPSSYTRRPSTQEQAIDLED